MRPGRLGSLIGPPLSARIKDYSWNLSHTCGDLSIVSVKVWLGKGNDLIITYLIDVDRFKITWCSESHIFKISSNCFEISFRTTRRYFRNSNDNYNKRGTYFTFALQFNLRLQCISCDFPDIENFWEHELGLYTKKQTIST